MSDEVAAQAVRHSDRLIELLPDNPASHEFAFHAAMHSPAPEPDFVCRCDASYPSLQLHIHKYSVLLPVSLLSTHLPVSLPRHVPPGGMPLMLAQLTYNLDLAVATMDHVT